MKRIFLKSSRIPASRDEVYRFHETPEALKQLTPADTPLQIVKPAPLDEGAETVMRVRLAPFVWVKWIARFTAVSPGYYFADLQVRGPFRFWQHVHRFIAVGPRETLLVDEIEYELPLGRVGEWVAGKFVESKLRAMFEYRHRRTAALVAQSAGG